MSDVKVCVIGIWHLGAVYSACLADLGYHVVGVDFDVARVEDLNAGIPPIFEPGLDEMLKTNLDSKRLLYTIDISLAVRGADYVLVTFDTPVDENDNVDLTPVFEACKQLGTYLKDGAIVIISSQVPVGSCDSLKSLIGKSKPKGDFDIVYSPENLRLGNAIEYFKKPDRIVIGSDNNMTLDKAEELFSVIPSPKLRMSLSSAEMTKHALNAFMATCISFGNEIANLCDETGADALEVAKALKSDIRIGAGIPLLPGLAFAGGTLARDLKVLKKLGKDTNYETALIDGVLTVNQRQNRLVVRKLKKIYNRLSGLNIGILGLTYKAGTSTLRRSAALNIIHDLVDEGAAVRAYDPKAAIEEVRKHKDFIFITDPYLLAEGADALVVVTDWPEFKDLDFDLIKVKMKQPVIIDAKNMFDRELLVGKGFKYSGVGRGDKL